MPVYEYRCYSCAYQRSESHSVDDTPFVTCPTCGRKLEKTNESDIPNGLSKIIDQYLKRRKNESK